MEDGSSTDDGSTATGEAPQRPNGGVALAVPRGSPGSTLATSGVRTAARLTQTCKAINEAKPVQGRGAPRGGPMKTFELVKEPLAEEAPTPALHDDLVGNRRSR
jgi:hypothetical protein